MPSIHFTNILHENGSSLQGLIGPLPYIHFLDLLYLYPLVNHDAHSLLPSMVLRMISELTGRFLVYAITPDTQQPLSATGQFNARPRSLITTRTCQNALPAFIFKRLTSMDGLRQDHAHSRSPFRCWGQQSMDSTSSAHIYIIEFEIRFGYVQRLLHQIRTRTSIRLFG
jgi:hypothetical protein